jgi:hypothetical protein
VIVLAAELTGRIVALLDRRPDVATDAGTPVAKTCCPVLRSTWPAPSLTEFMLAVRSDPGIAAPRS